MNPLKEKSLYYKQMEIEISPIIGFMVGVNYAYYPEEIDQLPLHHVQVGLGVAIVGITWIA